MRGAASPRPWTPALRTHLTGEAAASRKAPAASSPTRDQAVGGGPAHALPVVVEGLSQKPHRQGRVPHGGELVGGANAHRLGGLVAGAEPGDQTIGLLIPRRRRKGGGFGPRRRRPTRPHPVMVVAPDRGQVLVRPGQIDAGHRVGGGIPPVDFAGLVRVGRRVGGPVEPEPPHEAGPVLPGAPVVAAVVAPVEGVVGVEDDAARRQRRRLEGPHEGPPGVGHRLPHAPVVGRAAPADLLGIVLGVGAAHGLALHAAQVVVEVEVVGAGEVVLVLLVVKGPVVGVGHGGRGPHLRSHGLRVVEHLHLHRLVVAQLAAVAGRVVVLVPVLVPPAAGEGGVVGEGDDRPVLAQEPVAGPHEARGVEQLQDLRDAGRSHGLPGPGGLFLEVVDALVDLGGDPEAVGGQQDDPPAREVPHEPLRRRAGQRRGGGFVGVSGHAVTLEDRHDEGVAREDVSRNPLHVRRRKWCTQEDSNTFPK